MGNTVDIVHALGFDNDDIEACLQRRGLLSLELEFTRKCNLRCVYCYSSAGESDEGEMEIGEMKSVIAQAADLGARKIILLGGGEPLVYDGLGEIVEYISGLGLRQVLFTNGTLMTDVTAHFLKRNDVSVVVKCNSMRPEVQDELAGVKGTFDRIRKGLEHLSNAGYPDGETMLGVQTVICRQNISELPAMWEWARRRDLIPYFEIMTNQGRAKLHPDLGVPSCEIKELFDKLDAIDKTNFGIARQSHPTIAAFSCRRHLYSCLVNSRGFVQPCTGVDMAVGNIREKSLAEILSGSRVIEDLRNIYERIEGECRDCNQRHECYGCRGNAYQTTGNYLASDPSCWRCSACE
ncbi:MAG TPA: radical SAM protein [Dissulfurispiraceae bacterium]|nr:radical SAM protein [Dissulfurispiraceae bacterium]